MKNFQANLKKLEATDTQVLGVSMDSPFSNHAFAESIGVTFPCSATGEAKPPSNTASTWTSTKLPAA